jgi:PAS domain S-box-containing protein
MTSPPPSDGETPSTNADTAQTASTPSDRFGYLFDLIGDAVVEFEIREGIPIVRAVNPAFEDVFGYNREDVLGRSLNEFIVPDEKNEQATTFDRRTERGEENFAVVERQTATGVRDFLYRGVPYERADGRQYGFAIYSDITEQRRYERHMRVVHRLLRHDLRNSLSVILGAADQIAVTADDEEIVSFAEQISKHTNQLSSLGEEINTIERVLVGETERTSIDVAAECRHVGGQYPQSGQDGTVTVEASGALSARAVPEFRNAIEALVENGLVHGDDSPRVHVSAYRDSTRVVVVVADNGPGIPEPERASVFDDRPITQLDHGSGIGLWLVRWIVEGCQGELEYERTRDGWTAIRLLLQSVESQ